MSRIKRVNFWIIALIILGLSLGLNTIVSGATTETLVFLQAEQDLQTLYLADSSGSAPRALVSAKELAVFVQGKYLLYFNEQQLYRYDPAAQQFKPLTRLKADQVKLEVLAGAPDQALLAARDGYELHWYILELNDGSTRRISQPGKNDDQTKVELYSPDHSGIATLKRVSNPTRLELTVKGGSADQAKLSWVLPRNLTVLPQAPVWSPDSNWLAFYAKKQGNPEGYYSLQLLELKSQKLITIQEQVFAKFFIEELALAGFQPDWSDDGKYLAFQHQSYGAPTTSVLIKYDVTRGEKNVLVPGPGRQQYPLWSPSGRHLAFLSNREGGLNQVYIITEQGEKLQRLSPTQGQTEWALWYQP